MSQLQDPIRAHQAEQSPALFKEKLVWIQELWEMGHGLRKLMRMHRTKPDPRTHSASSQRVDLRELRGTARDKRGSGK